MLTAVSFNEPEKMFDSMQQALKKFFGSQEVLSMSVESGNRPSVSESPAVVIKSEPVFNTEEVHVVTRGRSRGFRGSSARSRGNVYGGNRPRPRYEKSEQKISYDRFGNMRCYECGS